MDPGPVQDKEKAYEDSDFGLEKLSEQVAEQSRANLEGVAAKFTLYSSSSFAPRLQELARIQPRLSQYIAANISRVPLVPPNLLVNPAFKRQISHISSAFALPDGLLKNLDADLRRFSESIKLQIRECLRSIQIAIPPLDPQVSDVISAMDGDRAAAERVAKGISWYPNQLQRECIRIKARVDGSSPERVRRNALIQGVLLALSGGKEDEVPILIGPESKWLYDDQQSLATIEPMGLPIDHFLNWLGEEAVRAAGCWLMGYHYAPSVVLEGPPDESSRWQFASFTSLPTEIQSLDVRRGRPFGSGVFENGHSFLEEIRLAMDQINDRDDRDGQERVAEVLSQRGLMGSSNPERQLRRWVREFDYTNWRDLLVRLELMSA